jgi:hypothetical protein
MAASDSMDRRLGKRCVDGKSVGPGRVALLNTIAVFLDNLVIGDAGAAPGLESHAGITLQAKETIK